MQSRVTGPTPSRQCFSAIVDKEKWDICVITTESFTKKIYLKICYALEHGMNGIITAEEMSYFPEGSTLQFGSGRGLCHRFGGRHVRGNEPRFSGS